MDVSLKNYEVIFIDFDGTLVDSLPLLYQVYTRFMKEHEIEGSREEFDHLNGRTIKEIFECLNQKYHLDFTAEQLQDRYHSMLTDLYQYQIQLFPDARSFLQRAFKMGKRLVIVTAAKKNLVDIVLEKQGVGRYFEMVVTAEKLEHGKPHPEIYLNALRLVGIAPQQAIVIEDSSNGLKAAKEAGLAALAFNHPHAEGVSGHIQNWRELDALLGRENFG